MEETENWKERYWILMESNMEKSKVGDKVGRKNREEKSSSNRKSYKVRYISNKKMNVIYGWSRKYYH